MRVVQWLVTSATLENYFSTVEETRKEGKERVYRSKVSKADEPL